jgi:hypothetical protein
MVPVRRAILKPRGPFHIDAVGIGVCVLASMAFYAVTIGPLLERQSVAARHNQELENQQQRAAGLEAAISTAKERLAAVQTDLAAETIELEAAARINKRVAALTVFFSHCGLKVDDVQTGTACRGLQYDVVPITIVGRGPYDRCVRFFHGLNATFPDMSVAHIDLTGNPTLASASEAFRFELFWYAAPDEQPPSASRQARPGEVVSAS